MKKSLLHTVYMPTVIFYNLRSPAVETQRPVPVEHFSYAHLNFLQSFLASHTIFGLSRACAQVDGLMVSHDTPVSHFRASTSLSHHWNWFHTTWRDFFMKYIYLPLGGGYLGLLRAQRHFSRRVHSDTRGRLLTHESSSSTPPCPTSLGNRFGVTARGDGPPAGVLVRPRGRGCVAAPPIPPPARAVTPNLLPRDVGHGGVELDDS